MEAKRVEVPALLRARYPKSEIAKILNVSRMTVQRVAVRLKNGVDLKDQHRSRPQTACLREEPSNETGPSK